MQFAYILLQTGGKDMVCSFLGRGSPTMVQSSRVPPFLHCYERWTWQLSIYTQWVVCYTIHSHTYRTSHVNIEMHMQCIELSAALLFDNPIILPL